MPEFQIARRTTEGVEIWHDAVTPFRASRTVIGTSFPTEDYSYCIVLAERLFRPKDPDRVPTRYYTVLDEEECQGADDLISNLIYMKDQWLSEIVACPDEPRLLRDALMEAEGLSGYRPGFPQEHRQRWASFVDEKTVAMIRDYRVEKARTEGDIESLLGQVVMDPDSGNPILDNDFRTVPRLYITGDLDTHKISAALFHPTDEPHLMTALWLAAHALEDSAPLRRRREEHVNTNPSGY